jgi:hypothetical protein
MKLTIELWRGLVADHLRRAWLSMWSDATDVEMDYAGERLVEDGWTVSRATWCVKQVVREAYSPKGIMASLSKADVGTRDRDGNVSGGWLQSKEHRAENQAATDERDRNECYVTCRDFPRKEPGCTRRNQYCAGCVGVAGRGSRQPVMVSEPRPGGATVERYAPRTAGEIAQAQVERLGGDANGTAD